MTPGSQKYLLVAEVFPPKIGGSGRWLHDIYSRFPRDQVSIVAGRCDEDNAFDRANQLLDVHRIPLSFSDWSPIGVASSREYWNAFIRIAKTMAKVNAREIHAAKALPEGLVAYGVARSRLRSYCCYVHGEEINVAKSSRSLMFLSSRVYQGARLLIANSQNTASLLQSQYRVEKRRIHIQHPGVDTQRYIPADSKDAELMAELGWRGRTVILTVGRLQVRKGHDVMIRALPSIQVAIPNVLYCILGDGPEKRSLESLVHELGLSNAVQFMPSADDDRVLKCYQHCDLFALPNREVDGDFEGFGIVLVEAQACGKPCVVGQSGGVGETIEPGVTGLAVDCRSPQVLSAAVVDLLSNDSRRQSMGAAARRRAVEKFDCATLAEKARELFSQSVAGSSVRAASELKGLGA